WNSMIRFAWSTIATWYSFHSSACFLRSGSAEARSTSFIISSVGVQCTRFATRSTDDDAHCWFSMPVGVHVVIAALDFWPTNWVRNVVMSIGTSFALMPTRARSACSFCFLRQRRIEFRVRAQCEIDEIEARVRHDMDVLGTFQALDLLGRQVE